MFVFFHLILLASHFHKVQHAVQLWANQCIKLEAIHYAQQEGCSIRFVKVVSARGQETEADIAFVKPKWKEATEYWLVQLEGIKVKKRGNHWTYFGICVQAHCHSTHAQSAS